MKRAKLLPTGEPRKEIVPLRLSTTEKEVLDHAAELKGLTLSTYITVTALTAACNETEQQATALYLGIIGSVRSKLKTAL